MICITIILTASFSGCNESTNTNQPETTTNEQSFNSTLQSSITLAGQYLTNAVNSQGMFTYEYNPNTNTSSMQDYNILRHAGTIYSMVKIYDKTNDKHLLQSTEKAIEYLIQQIKKYNETYCVVYNDKIKLGGSALAIIALVEYIKITGNNEHLQIIKYLSDYIIASQKPTGEFIHKAYYSTNKTSDFISEYYPGEAILALCRLYSITKNQQLLNTAEKATHYLIYTRDANKSISELSHDHWLLMALNELYRYQKNPIYYNHSKNIVSTILASQRNNITRLSEKKEWLGTYYSPPRSTPTAIRSEGLLASYHLFNDFDENQTFIHRIAYAINLSIQFQLQMQYTSETIKKTNFPNKAIGGFKESIHEYTIRIDYVQHNICSIIELYNIIRSDETFHQQIQQYQQEIETSTLNCDILEESLTKGAEFLVNNQKTEGNFNYEYNWINGTQNPQDSEVRQAGALWGIALLYQQLKTPILQDVYIKGYDFFKAHTLQGSNNQQWISYPNGKTYGKTGTIALVSLSIIDYLRSSSNIDETTRTGLQADLDSYLTFLLSLQMQNGLFHQYYYHSNGTGFGDPSSYFDGETLLALSKAYNYLGKTELKPIIIHTAYQTYQTHIIDALQTNADSSITKGFFQWGIMSYYEILQTEWPHMENYSTIIIGLADWMIDIHQTLNRTKNTAYAYEGIIHAYIIAEQQLDAYHVQKFKQVIDMGLYKLTSWQVGGPIPNEYLQNNPTSDPLAIGGIMNQKEEPPLRIDVTQHQMHALILAMDHVYDC